MALPSAENALIVPIGPDTPRLLRELTAVFGDAFEDPASYLEAPPSDAYLAGLLANPAFIAIAAVAEGAVIGGLVAYELKKFERERSEIYIYDLAVGATHRRKGVATKLIMALKALARQRGAYVIYVQADLVDDPAIALYTKLGLREDVLHFDIGVDD